MTGRRSTRRRRSAGSLPDHVRRTLVVAQTEEARLSEPSLSRPLGEADLRHDLRSCPMSAAGNRTHIGERRIADLELAQPDAQFGEPLGAVAGPDLPRISEPVRLVVPARQGAEVGSAAGRLVVPADHELLPEDALELQPVLGATARIGRIGTLGDQPFPARAASLRESTL